MKLVAVIALIILGEVLAIWSELLVCYDKQALWTSMFWITVAGFPLVFGYQLAYHECKNIWVVSASSLCSIVIIEPILVWIMFHQVPTLGPILGLVCGCLGLILAFAL